MFSALLLALALLQLPQQSAPPMGTPKPLTDEKVEKCIIEGKVTSAADGQPLKKATVTLMPQQQSGAMSRPVSTTSDADGKFIFKELDPVRYTLNAARNGYARQNYGARTPTSPGTTLAMDPGQHLKDINVRLTPGAAISGRIVDEDNDPVAGVQVRTARWGFFQGKRQLVTGGFASTDDRGQYRIYGLARGRYFVSATYQNPNAMMITGGDASPKDSEEAYAPTYYPGTFDASQASGVEVKPGDDIAGVVFRLARVRAVRVSGMVRGADGQPAKTVMLYMLPRASGMMPGAPSMRTTDEKGNFTYTGVMPGAYSIVVRGMLQDQQQFGRAEIDVGANALDNVVIQASNGVDIEASVHLDGPVDLTKTTVRLFLSTDELISFTPPSAAQIKEEGSVTLTKVYDGNYTVRAGPLPDDAYLSKAIFDEKDVLNEGLKVRGGGRLDVTISAAGAHVEGTVSDKDNKPFAGAQVVLVPEESKRSHQDLFRTASSDQYGHFVLRGIPPGTYKLFAWEAIDFGAYQDPEFLKAYEDQGKTIQLGSGEHSSPELKVIPAVKSGS
jgi:protocatechuate 3,4-dioxygenase beta subunit